jgi:2-oxoglutarate/2-oxoacid ferredoxin oxidoreductase subunit alpha
MPDSKIKLLSGNEAIAYAAIYAGCRFFSGYPITPSSEIAETLSGLMPKSGGVFIQAEDEIAAMAMIVGASLAGAKSMTATSGPGFSLKQENFGFGCMVEAPCVVVNIMRGGPSTGAPTSPSQADLMQARWGTHGDHPVIAISPASVDEAFRETVRAFNLAETYRTPVILLGDEVIAHLREKVTLPEPGDLEIRNRREITAATGEKCLPYDDSESDVPPMASFGDGHRIHVTGLNHDETGFPTNERAEIERQELRLMRKIRRNRADIVTHEEYRLDDAEVAIVAYGAVSRSARTAVDAMRADGHRVGLFRPITVWPFPARALTVLAKKVESIIVAEMSLGQIIREVERSAFGKAPVRGVLRANGELIAPAEIIAAVKESERGF